MHHVRLLLYKYNHPKQKRFRKTTVEWVVENNRPISVVEDKKLKLRRLSVQIQSSSFPALSRYFFSSDFFSSSTNSSNVSLSTFTLFDYSFISRLRVTSRQSLKRRKLLSPRSSRTSPILLAQTMEGLLWMGSLLLI